MYYYTNLLNNKTALHYGTEQHLILIFKRSILIHSSHPCIYENCSNGEDFQ